MPFSPAGRTRAVARAGYSGESCGRRDAAKGGLRLNSIAMADRPETSRSPELPDRDPFYQGDDGQEQGAESSPPPLPPASPSPIPPSRPADRSGEVRGPEVSEAQREKGLWVVQVYQVFAAGMVVVGLLGLLTGINTLVDPHAMPQILPYQNLVSGWLQIIVSLIAISAYGLLPVFLPREPWAWIIHLVLIGLAVLTCCAAPLAAPLMVMWLTPGVRDLFGYSFSDG